MFIIYEINVKLGAKPALSCPSTLLVTMINGLYSRVASITKRITPNIPLNKIIFH